MGKVSKIYIDDLVSGYNKININQQQQQQLALSYITSKDPPCYEEFVNFIKCVQYEKYNIHNCKIKYQKLIDCIKSK